MKTLKKSTTNAIQKELACLPKEYANSNFNSIHEGYAVILEEVRELEREVFFGFKECGRIEMIHKQRMRSECVQLAAMCVRFIQELT